MKKNKKVATQPPMKQNKKAIARPPIRPTGVIFALAANLLLVTVADLVATRLGLGVNGSVALRLLLPFLAGVITTLYVGQRGGIHAFLGGMISIPILALAILPGAWQVSLLAGALCTLGGAVTEVVRR